MLIDLPDIPNLKKIYMFIDADWLSSRMNNVVLIEKNGFAKKMPKLKHLCVKPKVGKQLQKNEFPLFSHFYDKIFPEGCVWPSVRSLDIL